MMPVETIEPTIVRVPGVAGSDDSAVIGHGTMNRPVAVENASDPM
jgi:hypothetical protein